jgi:hypothetical protein
MLSLCTVSTAGVTALARAGLSPIYSTIANKASNLILVPFGRLAQLVKAISHRCSSTWSVPSQLDKALDTSFSPCCP